MDFQTLSMTVVNAAMIMAMILMLRERVARQRRKKVEEQKLILDLNAWEKERIPFYKRKYNKATVSGLVLIGAVLVWIGTKSMQAFVETVLMTAIASAFMLYIRHLDQYKDVGAFEKGVLHKVGFMYYTNITGYTTSKSTEFHNAYDVWLMMGNTPKIQVHVHENDLKQFEKILNQKANIDNSKLKK